eukprot:785885-Alexandrium_andersonii.AAC.1
MRVGVVGVSVPTPESGLRSAKKTRDWPRKLLHASTSAGTGCKSSPGRSRAKKRPSRRSMGATWQWIAGFTN